VKSLSDLGTLRDAMRRRQREEAERAAHACEQAAREKRERELFAIVVGEVTKLRDRNLAEAPRARPAPRPRQRELDERAALDASMSDAFDAESLMETDDALSFRRADVGPDVPKRLRRGEWTIQAHLDLHRLTRDSARAKLAEFLHDAQRRGHRCLRVVHGKGHGSPGRQPVLKTHVRRWLAQRAEVAAFAQARPADGGAGAIVVLLRAGAGAPRDARAPRSASSPPS
jgi:DNA-nicking Smr family endonuclease